DATQPQTQRERNTALGSDRRLIVSLRVVGRSLLALSGFWRRFGFAYVVSDEGVTRLAWWVAATDLLVSVLLVMLLFKTATHRRPGVTLFLAAYAWANLLSWPSWYNWLQTGGDSDIGFPFPYQLGRSLSSDSIVLFATNVVIGIAAAYFIHRYSLPKSQSE